MDITNINPKIILSGSLTTARRYVKKKNIEGLSLMNFSLYTLNSLLKEKLMKINKECTLISNDECAYILLNLVSEKDYGLKRFVTSFGASSTLLDVINDYRYQNRESFTHLINADYKALLKDYVDYLIEAKKVDSITALTMLKDHKQEEDCYVTSDVYLRPLEKEVLESIFTNIEYISDDAKDYNVKEVFDCYGQYNEVLNVLDYLEEQETPIPLGDVEVLYSDTIYENIIKGVCSARNVPYVLKKNHAKSYNFVSFMVDVLTYYQNDYKYELLENILSNQGLNSVYLKEFYSTLVFPKYIVGFSKKRSKEFVEKYMDDQDKANFVELFNDLLAVTDNGLDYERLLEVAKKYIKAEAEKAVLSNPTYNLNNVIKLEKDPAKKIDLALSLLEKLTYSESDDDNKIVFSPINKSFTLRKHIFVLGVNQTSMVGTDVENAFINDVNEYKKELGEKDKSIHISDYQRMSMVNNLKYHLSHSDASIYLSYSSYDKIDLKDMTDCVRLLTSKAERTKVNRYYEQKGEVYFDNAPVIEKDEVELSYDNGVINPKEETLLPIKEEETATKPNDDKKDVFKLSPSAVANLVGCPYLFYYDKILGLTSTEYPKLDETTWLEANKRGDLFHKVMQLYFNNFINSPDVKNFNEAFYTKALDKALEEAEAANPVSNKYIHDKEVDDIKKKTEEYIKSILNKFDDYHVLANEFKLEKLNYFYFKNDDIKLMLHGYVDRVDGYVDNNVLHLRIVDYKTGNGKEKGEHSYYQHVLYSLVLERALEELVKEGKCEFGLQYSSIVVDKFIYDFTYASKELEYERYEFDKESPDYKLVTDMIDNVVLPYLKNEKGLLEKLDHTFFESNKQNHSCGSCKYCNYTKECLVKYQWGYTKDEQKRL